MSIKEENDYLKMKRLEKISTRDSNKTLIKGYHVVPKFIIFPLVL